STNEDNRLLASTEPRPRIIVLNKADLEPKLRESGVLGYSAEAVRAGSVLKLMVEQLQTHAGQATVRTSALTGEGIDELRRRMVEIAGAGAPHEPGCLTNARHQTLLQDSLAAVYKAAAAVEQKLPHEMWLLGPYGRLRA